IRLSETRSKASSGFPSEQDKQRRGKAFDRHVLHVLPVAADDAQTIFETRLLSARALPLRTTASRCVDRQKYRIQFASDWWCMGYRRRRVRQLPPTQGMPESNPETAHRCGPTGPYRAPSECTWAQHQKRYRLLEGCHVEWKATR